MRPSLDTLLPLHALIDGLADPLTLPGEMAWRVEQVQRCLDEGADANGVDEHGRRPMDVLAGEPTSGEPRETTHRDTLVNALFLAGANPLLGQRAFFTQSHDNGMLDIAAQVVALGRRGTTLRDDDGGNLLHVLASTQVQTLGHVLAQHSLPHEPPADQAGYFARRWDFPLAWLGDRRESDGATPAHALWTTFTQRWQGNGNTRQQVVFQDLEIYLDVWATTGSLVALDMDSLFVADQQGLCAGDTIEDFVMVVGPIATTYSALSEELLARNARRKLEANTSASAGRDRGLRL